MNLLVVSKQYGRFNGAAIATCELISRWASIFERIDVICSESWYQSDRTPTAENIVVHPLKFFNPLFIREKSHNLVTLESLLYSPDDYGIFAKLKGLPYVITNHSNWPWALVSGPRYFIAGLFHIPLYILNFLLAQAVINVSYFGAKWVSMFNSNCYVIRNGITIRMTGKRVNLKHPNIMTIGSMDSRKGTLLAQIIDELKKICENWYLYIIGHINCRSLLKRVDNQRVFAVGYVDNVGDYLVECDVFILASYMENLSIAATEAMYLEKPVVCFDVGGMAEIVSERTGALIKKYDIKQFARIITLLLQNPDMRKQKGIQARKVVQEFDWDESAKKYIEVFKRVLNDR